MPALDDVFGIPANALKLSEQRIPQLIAHFHGSKSAASSCPFDHSAIQRLQAHNWNGNVRELRNIVERAGVLFHGEMIDAFSVDQLLGRTAPRLSDPQRLTPLPDPVPTKPLI